MDHLPFDNPLFYLFVDPIALSLAYRCGMEYFGRVPKSAPGFSRISWFIFLSGGRPSGMTSGNTSGCWSITSSVVSSAALMFPLVGVQLIQIPCFRKSIANPPHSMIATCCFRNGIPITASYFAKFLTNILLPFVCSLSTAISTTHSF